MEDGLMYEYIQTMYKEKVSGVGVRAMLWS
jgi:hypothetical protein